MLAISPTPSYCLRFEHDVWPIIADDRVGCHGADEPKAGLSLRTVARMQTGGESGLALDQADRESSLLLERIARREMPPGKALDHTPRIVPLAPPTMLRNRP
jgi:Planctomycete cytochrome C